MFTEVIPQNTEEKGFSLLELLIVLVIVSIFIGTTMFFFEGHKKLYKPDDTTLLITDALQEARQRSLTQRTTIRVEIDNTKKLLSVINENQPNTPDDDSVVRVLSLPEPSSVTVGPRPGNIPDNPLEPLPVPNAVFIPSVYTPSYGDNVCTLRFQRNGTVVNAGTNAIGTDAVVTGATIHIWSPNSAQPANSDIARAITVIGSSGTIRAWEYDADLETASKWKDSRRTGSILSGGS